MKLRINGEEREVPELSTVQDLVDYLGIHRMIVIQQNEAILRRESFGSAPLREGDVLEIVHMVGGG